MNIVDLQGMDLVGLTWSETRFEITAIDESCAVFQATLSNPDQAALDVKVHWLDLRMIFDNESEITSFGEIETISIEDGCVHIETDAGYFSVTAAKTFVQRLTSSKVSAA